MEVLFCETNSVYFYLGCDVYTINNSALNCKSILPAIYHPPCREWSRMRKFANWHPGEKWLGVWAIMRARKYGGIVEHPMGSYLFKFMHCPSPGIGYDKFGGFTIQVSQVEFGHKCRKLTWLYIVGLNPVINIEIPFPGRIPSHVISQTIGKPSLSRVSRKYRSYTPILFAKELIRLCSLIAPTGYGKK